MAAMHSYKECVLITEIAKLMSCESFYLYSTHAPAQLSWHKILSPPQHTQTFRCILCKGVDHPSLHPRPVMMTLPLQVPLCDVSSERGKLEEEFVRQTTLQPSNATGISKCLMKMFAVSWSNNLCTCSVLPMCATVLPLVHSLPARVVGK